MTKPIKEYIFKNVGGMFVNVAGESETLADILRQLEIVIDDKCQFARFYDYENERCIYYRAYNWGKITITIWKLEIH